MKTLLLIEDDTVLRETTAEILELEGYKVVVAANGKRGIEQARIMLPDIIICDIMMPELDGYDVFKLLSEDETTKKIPFIFMSAKTEMKDIRKGMDLGADDYLTKPVEEELLLSAIESRLAKAVLLNEALNKDFPYLGAIGSNSKRNAMEKELLQLGQSKESITNFICPIGEDIGSNDPAEIAISITAQLLKYRDLKKS